MKTGITVHSNIKVEDIFERYAHIKKLGYDSVDQNINDVKNVIYHNINELNKFCDEVKRSAEANGLEISQIHGPWPTDDSTEESRTAALEYYKTSIYACHRMSSKIMIVHPVMPYGWGHEDDADFAEQLTIDRLKALIPACEKYGVTVCLENMPMTAHRISTIPYIVRAVEKVNSPYIKVCLDTGHVNVFRTDIGEAVTCAAPYLCALHIHDNDGHSDQHKIPYTGTVNWESFINALSKSGFKGTISLECDIRHSIPDVLREEYEQYLSHIASYFASQCEE